MLFSIVCCAVNQLLLSLGASPSRRIESILLQKQPSQKTHAPLEQESALKCPQNGCVSVKTTAQTTHRVSLTGQWWGEVKSVAKTLDCTKHTKKFNNATSRRPTRISTNKSTSRHHKQTYHPKSDKQAYVDARCKTFCTSFQFFVYCSSKTKNLLHSSLWRWLPLTNPWRW